MSRQHKNHKARDNFAFGKKVASEGKSKSKRRKKALEKLIRRMGKQT